MKGAQSPQRPLGRVDGALELYGEDRLVLPQAQEQVAVAHHVARMGHRHPGQARTVRPLLDQGPPLPQDHGLGVGLGGLFRDPVGVVAKVARPVERIAGEGVLKGHATL